MDELAGPVPAYHPIRDVVEVGYGMPCDVRDLNPMLYLPKKLLRCICVWLPVKDEVNKYVRVYEHHWRYFFASAS